MSYLSQRRAQREAERVRSRAFWRKVLNGLRGVDDDLLPFSAVQHLHPNAESYGGTKAIPVDQIVGSVDRYRDFDHYFLPKVNHTLDRWAGIRQAGLEGKELPAIQVYKVGNVYFVKDGHHRVSVARNAGQKYLDAEIIELSVTVPPDSTDSIKDLIIKGEYAGFLEQTRLGQLKPDHERILFTVPGRYDILVGHINTRKYYLGRNLQRDVSWEEAVCSWHDRLYARVVEQIRKYDVLKRFPGRTEADLYLWIMDHRYNLTQQFGQDVGSEEATKNFSDNFAPDFARRTWQRFVKRWRGRLPD